MEIQDMGKTGSCLWVERCAGEHGTGGEKWELSCLRVQSGKKKTLELKTKCVKVGLKIQVLSIGFRKTYTQLSHTQFCRGPYGMVSYSFVCLAWTIFLDCSHLFFPLGHIFIPFFLFGSVLMLPFLSVSLVSALCQHQEGCPMSSGKAGLCIGSWVFFPFLSLLPVEFFPLSC